MERKFLKDLGIAEETIEKIMAEHGKSVEKVKGERDNYKTQLDTAQTTLKSFEGVDVNDLKGKVDQLTRDLEAKDKEYATKLDDRDFDAAFRNVTRAAKARNHDVLVAALGKEKVDALRTSKNREKDIEAAVNALKADREQAYLFEAERAPRAVGFTPGAAKDDDTAKSMANEGIRSLFGKGGN
jgi:hypothetical protein